jgi:IS5 family transposase
MTTRTTSSEAERESPFPLQSSRRLQKVCCQADFHPADVQHSSSPVAAGNPVQQRVSCIHVGRLPDESTILRFRHRLEKYKLAEQILVTVNELLIQRGLLLKAGTVVDATLIAAPTSTKNKGKRATPRCTPAKRATRADCSHFKSCRRRSHGRDLS